VPARDLTQDVSKSSTNVQETTEASTGGITTTGDIPASGDTPVESSATEAVPAPTVIDIDVQDSTVDNRTIQNTLTEVQDNTQDITVSDDQECNTQEVTGMASITDQELIVDKQSTSDNQETAIVQSPTIVVQEAEQGNTQELTTTVEPVTEPVDFISDLPTVQDEIQTPDPTLQPSITTGRYI